jgi:uncharacterized damage-inducible protein DinB
MSAQAQSATERDRALREQLRDVLSWRDAHVGFDAAVDGIPSSLRGTAPKGLPYSPWQLLEHMRLTQHDILDFCRNPNYAELRWPQDYWPISPAPSNEAAWEESVAAFRQDREALRRLAEDGNIDLFARIPHGSGQTYLRELLLVADHTAYHVGQLVVVRRCLNAWRSS